MQTGISPFLSSIPILSMPETSSLLAQEVTGSLALDGLGLFVLLLTITVSLVGLWATMGQPGIVTHCIMLVLFIAGVFLMVSSTNLLLFFVLWELVTVISWGIARRSGLHSFPLLGPLAMQGVGGVASVCMLAALMFLAVKNETLSMTPLVGGSTVLITVLFLVAIYLKVYGLLTQTWLPGEPHIAGAANTLLAGAAVVALGFYPYLRFFWIILGSQNTWRDIALPVSLAIGVFTVIIALGEHDTHRMLSYGVLSQFAWFAAAFALFGPEQAGILFLALSTCILALSGLYVVLGLTESISGKRDLHQAGGLIKVAPLGATMFLLLALAAVGLPPFGGFIGRLSVELPLLMQGNMTVMLIMFAIVGLTLLYLLRMFGTVFLGELREPVVQVNGISEYMAVSVILIALLTIGITSPTISQWIQATFVIPMG